MHIQSTATTHHHYTQDFAQMGQQTTTVHRLLHKRLKLYADKVQILQELKPNDGPKRKAFALEMLSRIEDDEDYLKKIMFTD